MLGDKTPCALHDTQMPQKTHDTLWNSTNSVPCQSIKTIGNSTPSCWSLTGLHEREKVQENVKENNGDLLER